MRSLKTPVLSDVVGDAAAAVFAGGFALGARRGRIRFFLRNSSGWPLISRRLIDEALLDIGRDLPLKWYCKKDIFPCDVVVRLSECRGAGGARCAAAGCAREL